MIRCKHHNTTFVFCQVLFCVRRSRARGKRKTGAEETGAGACCFTGASNKQARNARVEEPETLSETEAGKEKRAMGGGGRVRKGGKGYIINSQ